VGHLGLHRLLRVLNNVFHNQARDIARRVALSGNAPDLTTWLKPMVEVVTPFLLHSYQTGMLRTLRRLGERGRSVNGVDDGVRTHRIDHGDVFGVGKSVVLSGRRVIKSSSSSPPSIISRWDVYNPRVLDSVDEMAFRFCRETLATLTTDLDIALERLREELRRGLSGGEATVLLVRSIRRIFADPARAHRIAVTELSRATHGGQVMAARDSGVTHKAWLASADACEHCLALDGEERGLDEPFWVNPKGGPYAVVNYPPLHPNCMCTMTEVI